MVGEAAQDVREAAERTSRTLFQLAEDTIYAYLGAADALVEGLRRTVRGAMELPRDAYRAAIDAPERWRQGFEELSERGRKLIGRIEDRDAVKQATRRAQQARAQAKGAATSMSKAARSAAKAVREAADSLGSAPAISFEDRTYDDLYEMAAQRNIEGRSSMNKEELIAALRS
jgi:hypothetical protein